MFWLERGFHDHDKGMDSLGTEPLFDGCRNRPKDRRFELLLQQLKLL